MSGRRVTFLKKVMDSWQSKVEKTNVMRVVWTRRKSPIRRISIRPTRASTRSPSPRRSGQDPQAVFKTLVTQGKSRARSTFS